MKKHPVTFAFTLTLAVLLSLKGYSQEENREYYQLKTYTLTNEKQDSLMDAYLEDAYLPALKRAGIKNVGVFKFRPSDFLTANKIFVLIPFVSLEQFETLDDMLAQDKSYVSAGMPYLKAKHDEPPYERISSTLMKAFSGMPRMQPSNITGPRQDRVYELRSYESPTETAYRKKVDMFNLGDEIGLFKQIGANAVFYAEVLSGDRMPNLVYMTTYSNMEKRDATWETFANSEKWKSLKADPQYANIVNKSDIMLLYPTEYSDY